MIADLMGNLNPPHWKNLDEKCDINLHDRTYMPNMDVINLGKLVGHSYILKQIWEHKPRNSLAEN